MCNVLTIVNGLNFHGKQLFHFYHLEQRSCGGDIGYVHMYIASIYM